MDSLGWCVVVASVEVLDVFFESCSGSVSGMGEGWKGSDRDGFGLW
jgi:hypothetical protein